MEKSGIKSSNFILNLESLMLFVIFYISIVGINENLFILGSSITLLLMYQIYNRYINVSLVDLCVILLWIYSLISTFTSINFINSFLAFKTLTIGVVSYFIIRLKFKDVNAISKLLFSCSTLIGILEFISVVSFFMFSDQICGAGFDNLYDFRFKYQPLGNIPNVWASLLICFLGIIISTIYYYYAQKKMFCFLLAILIINIWGIIVSFSRGIYLSFIFLLISFFYYIAKSKIEIAQKIRLSIMILVPSILFIVIHEKDVIKTIDFNKTVSQQRSIAGRIDAMQSSKNIFLEAPLIGVGAGNFSLAINEYRYEDDNNKYTSFAPNGFTQLLVEQGLIGFCLWAVLIIILLIQFIRNSNTLNNIIIIAFLALLIREATFSVFFYHLGMLLIGFILFALHQNNTKIRQYKLKVSKYFILSALLVLLVTVVISIKHTYDTDNNCLFIKSFNEGKFEQAESFINKTSESAPYLFNRSALNYSLFKQNHDSLYLTKSKHNLYEAFSKNKRDYMLQHNFAMVLKEEGKIDSALIILNQLTDKFPNNALYNYSYFSVLYEKGDTEVAINYLIKAIELSPNILESTFWKEIKRVDSTFTKKITDELLLNLNKHKEITNPIILAKRGAVLFLLEQYTMSEVMLKKVVQILPNLLMPWYYLGQIETKKGNVEEAKKYYLCSMVLDGYNVRHEDIMHYIHSGDMHRDIKKASSLYSNYRNKFLNWYKIEPLIIDNYLK